jgi:hypothetical protein
MSNPESKPDPKELCIPIYLNQKIVFDLLAVQEDGFSQLSTLRTSSSDSEATKNGVGASIGVSNVFALLGVSFSGERGKEKGYQDQTEISQEKVHTPTSLFAKCRSNLIVKGLLHQDISLENFKNLKSGDFVEFQAILHKNPIVDILTWIKAFGEMIMPFISTNTQGKNSGQQRKSEQVFDKKIIGQIDAVLKMVTPSDSIELIGEFKNGTGIKAVITCQPDFFNRSDPNEIIDGEFFVIGKVVKVVPDNSNVINLLRKTPLGRLDSKMLSGLTAPFSQLDETGFQQDLKFTTSIEGPSFLIIPIAIFL